MNEVIATPQKANGTAWHSQSAKEVLAQLGLSANGLSGQEAANRLAANGPNELKEGQRVSAFHLFPGQFKSVIIWILIAAGANCCAPWARPVRSSLCGAFHCSLILA